jgi:glycosyltransferase involved in cell wall biosynthesis
VKKPRRRSRITFVGQFPPPINGLTLITSRLALALGEAGYEIAVVNTAVPASRRSILFHGARVAKTIRAMTSIASNALSRKSRACYFTAEGGFGLIYSVMLACCARLFCQRIYVHHHSFSYIVERRILMSIFLACAGPKAIHIFLSSEMAKNLADRYGRTLRSLVVSNAAFVDSGVQGERPSDRKELVIGLLSNLTADKGLHEFIAVLRLSKQRGLPVRGVLAGPATRDLDGDVLAAAKVELGDRLDYRGPVYGSGKIRFFEDVDVFVFLTTYLNEAQPTVLFEAMASGVPVISYDRGCIRSQVANGGYVFPKLADNAISATVDILERYCLDPGVLAEQGREARRQFEDERRRGQGQTAELFESKPIDIVVARRKQEAADGKAC